MSMCDGKFGSRRVITILLGACLLCGTMGAITVSAQVSEENEATANPARAIESLLVFSGFNQAAINASMTSQDQDRIRVDLDVLRSKAPDQFVPGRFDRALGELGLANAASVTVITQPVLVVRVTSRNSLIGEREFVLGRELRGGGWLLLNGIAPEWLPKVVRAVLALSSDRQLRSVEPWEPTLRAMLRRAASIESSVGDRYELRMTLEAGMSLVGARRAFTQISRSGEWVSDGDGLRFKTPNASVAISEDDGPVVLSVIWNPLAASGTPE